MLTMITFIALGLGVLGLLAAVTGYIEGHAQRQAWRRIAAHRCELGRRERELDRTRCPRCGDRVRVP